MVVVLIFFGGNVYATVETQSITPGKIGAIVGIVLASVVAVGAIVAVIIILKKGNKKKAMIKLEKSSNLQYSSEESN